MEKLLHLFNTLWFDHVVLSSNTTPFDSVTGNESVSDPDRPLKKISHVRSSSDQQLALGLNVNALLSDAESPKSVLRVTPKLETVVSGKEIGVGFGEGKMSKVVGRGRRRRRSRRSGRSKSLTEMEFEEVKGFMDLGFVFSEEDHKDSNLVSIIPGLQRLGCGTSEGDGVCVKCGRRRCERKDKILLRVGGVVDELEMKNQIKFWAHTVASAVK